MDRDITMPLQPVTNSSLADQIFAQIVTEILGERYAAGTKLPPERELAETFQVNRHVVREALKRLAQMGLVRISQGDGTEVLNYRQTAGLDVLGLIARHSKDTADLLNYWRSVLEMRAALAADVARLCAERASPALKRDLKSLRHHMTIAQDDHAIYAMEVSFWDLLLKGSGNMAYRLAFNSLLRSLQTLPQPVMQWSLTELRASSHHERLVQAIDEGDADTAEQTVRTLMRKGLAAFNRFAAAMSPPRQAVNQRP